eukprot:1939812-Prymnesium_polylepis.1
MSPHREPSTAARECRQEWRAVGLARRGGGVERTHVGGVGRLEHEQDDPDRCALGRTACRQRRARGSRRFVVSRDEARRACPREESFIGLRRAPVGSVVGTAAAVEEEAAARCCRRASEGRGFAVGPARAAMPAAPELSREAQRHGRRVCARTAP